MRIRLLSFVALVVLAAGCGGSGGGGSASGDESAAGVAPATTRAFVTLNTDLGSDQVRQADRILQKFPIRDEALRRVRSAIRSGGVDYAALKRSIGPELDLAVLDDTGTMVAFTKPADEQEFERVLESESSPQVHTKIGDWVAFADDRAALDAVKTADKKLDDLRAYNDATAELPGGALATAYVAGETLAKGLSSAGAQGLQARTLVGRADWLSAAALAHDEGFDLQVYAHGQKLAGGKSYNARLADDIPAGAILAASFRQTGDTLRGLRSGGLPIGMIERALGVRLEDVASLLDGEGALYVKPGTPIPEVTILLEQRNEARAERTLDKLVDGFAASTGKSTGKTEVDGVTLDTVDLGPLTAYYGVFDGKLILTDNANAVRDIRGNGDRLADDKTFASARDAAAMPEETNGWVYANLKDGVPLVEGLAELGGQHIPAKLHENLRPLRTLLLYGTRTGATQSLHAFLQTS